MNAHSLKANKTEVLIVGGGPLGWACGRLLARKKIRTLVVDPHQASNTAPWSQRGLGLFWPSLNDPPTRAVVAHGLPMARWLQEFCRHGQDLITELFPASIIQKLNCVRVGILDHEISELDSAFAQNLALEKPQRFSKAKIFPESAPAFLLERPKTLSLPQNERKFLSFKRGIVTSAADSKDNCTAILSTGENVSSEMIILANGFEIGKLEPWLKDMLIPMSDVETHWTTNLTCPANARPVAIRAANGHVASVFFPSVDPNQGSRFTWSVRMTGPRFMLPSAGAGVDLSLQSVDGNLQTLIEQWLVSIYLPALCEFLQTSEPTEIKVQLKESRFAADCLPCDELPMLGDLGHQGRILGSTGWLACGWSASLQSAAILCELIVQGQSTQLAPLLRPRRWRSGLAEDGVTGMT